MIILQGKKYKSIADAAINLSQTRQDNSIEILFIGGEFNYV